MPDMKQRAKELREIGQLMSRSIKTLASEWESAELSNGAANGARQAGVPRVQYDASRTIQACIGSLTSLVTSPHSRLTSLAMSYTIARVLHLAVEHNIAELLAPAGDDGTSAVILAASTGLEPGKLCRVLRALASHHVFKEVGEGRFANNHVSEALVGNSSLRSFIRIQGRISFTASAYLTSTLSNPDSGHSYDVCNTAVQQAIGKRQSYFDWLQEKVPESAESLAPLLYQNRAAAQEALQTTDSPTGKLVPRPELGLFHEAMKGLSRGQFATYDFPWESLSETATVVDVGGGIGSFCMELHDAYPKLNLIVQDRAPVVQQGIAAWNASYPQALAQGKIQLQAHDFFEKNPVLGADVYWLRYVIHDWPDAQAIDVLSQVAKSMGPDSRLLIADVVMNTTLGSKDVESAPRPLLKNYGQAMAFVHMMDINIMTMLNGVERTPAELHVIAEASGLAIHKIWPCRGQLSIVECRLAVSRE